MSSQRLDQLEALCEHRDTVETLLREIAKNTGPTQLDVVPVRARGSLFETMVQVIDFASSMSWADGKKLEFKALVSKAGLDHFRIDPPQGFSPVAIGIPIFSVHPTMIGKWRDVEIHFNDSITPEFFRLVPR